MGRYYIGLATTFHDPALAIVGPDGEVRFAEATERPLQSKRAFSCPPDDLLRTPGLIRQYCEPDAELVVTQSWSLEHLSQDEVTLSTDGSFPALRSRALDSLPEFILGPFWPWPLPRHNFNYLTGGIIQAGHGVVGNPRISNSGTMRYRDHHLTHAAAGAFASPYSEAAVAVIDGYGQFGSTSFYRYRDGRLEPIVAPIQHGSLGIFYSMVCNLAGFEALKGEEWKVMGLAPYGQRDEELYALLRPILKVQGLGFVPDWEAHMRCLHTLIPRTRKAGSPAQEAADLAHTGQLVFSELCAEILNNLYTEVGCDKLVFCGGCALNSTFSGQITELTPFREVYIPSAPGDDGNAIGAAWLAYQEDHPDWKPPATSLTPFLGSSLEPRSIENLRRFSGLEKMRHLPGQVHQAAAELLTQGKLIGWVQGRAEFGPRALGHRSILADPRSPQMKDILNERVKFREEFRPFAPSVLPEYGAEYFENFQDSPYMSKTLRFRPEVRDRVPAVVHANDSGRVQTVERAWSPQYYDLIDSFRQLTGVPMVLNTSFNVMGKPIIHSVEDALGVFFTSGLDALVLEDWLIEKAP